ncbi:MAG: hypothetical protein ACI8ZM_000587 [Crocinitomix sp.]|jgi:hypothetical protein
MYSPTLYSMTGEMRSILCIFLIGFGVNSSAQERTSPANQSEELGDVSWYRDYDQALELSKRETKPILILFQEVPGCSTCRNYGHNVLTHPLMVEAIETLFIPVAIYNNKGGKDKVVLEKFGEPSWNNPVVRIVDANGLDVVPRISGDYAASSLAKALLKALKKAPDFLELLSAELTGKQSNSVQTAYFKMYCFWSGEKHLGALNGVLSTTSGFMSGAEVVKVQFDQNKVTQKALVNYAEKQEMTLIKDNGKFRIAKDDDKFYLQKTNYKYLPLTNLQQTRINSKLGRGESARNLLSPIQLDWFLALRDGKGEKIIRFNQDFSVAWSAMK